MYIITKSFMAVLIGFILSIITGYILIPILKKLKANQSISIYLEREHNKKNHTPTIGGLIFIIPTIFTTIILLILKKIELNYTIIITMITFISYSIIEELNSYPLSVR